MEKSDAKKHSLRKLSALVWEESLRMPFLSVGIILVVMLAEATHLVGPYLMQRLVDGVVNGTFVDLDTFTIILWYILPIAGIGLIGSIFWRTGGFIASVIMPRLRMRFVEHGNRAVFAHSYRFFADRFTGSLVRNIRSLGDSGSELLEALWWSAIPITTSVVLGTLLVSRKSLALGISIAIWFALMVALNLSLARIKLPFDNIRAEAFSKVVGTLSDTIANIVNINLFTSRRDELARTKTQLDEAARAGTKAWQVGEWGFSLQNVLVFFCEFAVLAISIARWKAGLMTVGEIVFVQGVLVALFMSTFNMGHVIRRVFEAASDAHEMMEIMDTMPEVRDLKSAKKLQVKKAHIQFEHVSFQYTKKRERTVLHNVTLDIQPREKVALIGPSGAGKSTVTKLLFRFFDVSAGRILIDGQDISRVKQESLREAIAFVPQESILFHRSLLENIRYGKRNATDKEVFAAARAARCHEFISAFPDGYETLVGERGVKLSGGERQRVAIARAILRDAPILVLDEATSSLDSESELLIQGALENLMKNKTVIAIAHRLSTIMEMDRIIVMEDGHIIDEGTHEELKAKVGTYQKLWNIQVGGFKV